MALLETLQEQRSQILEIVAKHRAFNGRVFTSVVRREETPESDIHICLNINLLKA